MTHFEPQAILRELIELPAETEWVEFKEAKNNFDFNELDRYFSALSNEANLKRKPAGWLIFGVTDKQPRKLCGSNYRLNPPGLDRLKHEISKQTNHQITFTEIHEIHTSGVRIIMFEIPPAPKGIPTEWNERVYGRHRKLFNHSMGSGGKGLCGNCINLLRKIYLKLILYNSMR